MKLDSATMSKPERLLFYSLWMVIALFALTVTSTHYCEISDPETHAKYDLRELIPSDEDIDTKFTNIGIRIPGLIPLFHYVHKIRIRLCSPLKCNNQDGYALCMHYFNYSERAIGKFPPQVSYENGHTLFKFEGDICSGSTRYNLTISVMCDYQAGNNSYPILVNFHPDSCNIHIKWPTSVICPTRKYVDCTAAHNNDHYDLTSLINYSGNYEFHTKYTSPKILLNVCHSLNHKPGINCSSEAGICMFDERRRKYLNLGKVQRPPFFANGHIRLEYQDGDLCDIEDTMSHTLLRYKTSITFVCSSPDKNGLQQYTRIIDECHYNLTWYTPAACSIRSLLNNDSYIPGICSFVNPITKSIYNLEPLMHNDYEVEGERHGYKIRICKPLSYMLHDGCGEGTGICDMMSDVTKGKANSELFWKPDVAKGKANSELIWTSDGPYLKYISNARCDDNDYGTTIIQFICSTNELDSRPIVVKDDKCHTVIHWKTNLVCEKQVQCVTNDTDKIDLTPLMQYTKNYILKDVHTNVEYHINICRPLVATPNLNCGHASAVCLVEKDLDSQGQHEVSLGHLENIPKLNEDLQVVLRYVGGGRCIENYYKSLSTNITFICSSNDQVSPIYKNYIDCTYLFEWNTKLACGTMIGTWLPPCILEEKVFAHVYDLSALYKKQQMHYVKDKNGKEYNINICNTENYCNGSAVCREDNNYGSLHGVFFNYKQKYIRLEYSNGDFCRECEHCVVGTYAAEIIFTCNESIGIGTPRIRMESKCKVEFEWQTELICTLNLHANFQNITTDLQNVTVDNELESKKQQPQISIGDHIPKGSPSSYAPTVIIFVILILVLVAMAVILRHRRERVWFYNHLRICFQACMLRFYRGWNENPVIFREARFDEDSSHNASDPTVIDNDDDNASL